ncbi:MAG: hypothetical protein WCA95_00065 [Opitutaceae bacterium]
MRDPNLVKLLSRAGVVVMITVPAIVYMAILAMNSVNMPVGDDIGSIIGFLSRWHDSVRNGNLSIGPFFDQFYSHRIPFTRLIVALQSTLLGQIDLRVLHVVSWIGWLLLLATLVGRKWSARNSHLWLVPVTLILMQPQGFTNFLIASGSPGHAWTILLAYWAIYLSKFNSKGAIGLAVLFGLGSAMCTVNGLLVFPAIVMGNVIRNNRPRAVLWSSMGVIIWILYLHGYSVSDQPIVYGLLSIWRLAFNSAVLAGAIGKFGTMGLGILAAFGCLLIIAAGLSCWRKGQDEDEFELTCLLSFLLLSILMIAFARGGWDAEYMEQDRYRLYGLILIAALYLTYADRWNLAERKVALAFAIGAALFFNVSSYAQQYGDLRYSANWARAAAMDIQIGNQMLLPPYEPKEIGQVTAMMRKVVSEGLYQPAKILTPSQLEQLRIMRNRDFPKPNRQFRCVQSEAFGGYLFTPLGKTNRHGGDTPDFGVLFEDDIPIVVPVVINRARFRDILVRRSFLSDDFGVVLTANCFERGRHMLYGVKDQADSAFTVLWSSSVECP